MFRVLKRTDEGFRNTPGTALKNESTGAIVYVPPQSGDEIVAHMTALERFINDDSAGLDPLVKMALIHHQFESIHPFSDGNGRIGRIINVLYLTKVGLLEIPILYLSRYITTLRLIIIAYSKRSVTTAPGNRGFSTCFAPCPALPSKPSI
jgi:Fic family protein